MSVYSNERISLRPQQSTCPWRYLSTGTHTFPHPHKQSRRLNTRVSANPTSNLRNQPSVQRPDPETTITFTFVLVMAALSGHSFLMALVYDSTSWPSSIHSSVTNALLPSVTWCGPSYRLFIFHLISLAFTFRQLVFDRFSFFIIFKALLYCIERIEKIISLQGRSYCHWSV